MPMPTSNILFEDSILLDDKHLVCAILQAACRSCQSHGCLIVWKWRASGSALTSAAPWVSFLGSEAAPLCCNFCNCSSRDRCSEVLTGTLLPSLSHLPLGNWTDKERDELCFRTHLGGWGVRFSLTPGLYLLRTALTKMMARALGGIRFLCHAGVEKT